MDDILSAALGKSGLDLSFLEEQQPHQTTIIPTTNQVHYNFINSPALSNGNIDYSNPSSRQSSIDDSEDLTDFLNLLGDAPPNTLNNGKASFGNGNKTETVDDGSDMLDYLLKYNSDDEDNSNISTTSIPLSLFNMPTTQAKVLPPKFVSTTIVNQFPKIQNSHHKKIISITKDIKTNSSFKVNIPTIIKKEINGLRTLSSPTTLQKQIIINKVSTVRNSRPNSPVITKTIPKITTVNKPTSNININNDYLALKQDESEIDKKRKSIQHVLSSPNLTMREKQFLMKSAITHKMDPSSFPILNSSGNTIKSDLTSLLKTTARHSLLASTSTGEEEDDEEDSDLIHSNTFAEYWPSKVKVGHGHPDAVVETSSMASVVSPDVWYNLAMPSEVIDGRKLSALQLESIVYASQQHEKLLPNGKRAGFLIGDGAGVGKGRTVAGIIYENYLHGRKRAIWLSVSNDLRFDAIRDLRDIGCHAKVHPLNKFKYDEKISAAINGKFKKGVVFATYSSLIGETSHKVRFKSRLEQLVHWCGKDFDGVIILDECHKAKNLMPVGSSKPTKTGITVLKLQNMLPRARVVYCSATGASEPKNMAYMNRLGLWGPSTAFKEFTDFISSVEKRGVGAMEMVAMDMKLRGMYIARQLSFTGVSFDVKEVKLCPSFIEMYDAAVKLWLDARAKFEQAADLVGLDGKGRKTMWGQYWSAHQRFFKYLCIAAKVKQAVCIAKEAIDLGKCVIFGLQSTGEARTLDQIDDMQGELTDFISTTKGVFSTLVEKHFPTTENPNRSTFDIEDRKRKRDWRKNLSSGSKRRRGDNGVGYMSSDGSSDSEKEYNTADETSDILLSDKESDVSDDEEKDPFAESSDESDDEDAWLKAASEKKPKKQAEKSNKAKTKLETPTVKDPGMNALAAAGFNVGRQFSWANLPNTKTSGSSENMKSSRTTKIDAPSGLSQQMNNVNSLLKRTTSSDIEHCKNMKKSLIDQLEVISPYLPPNTLDELIDELGGPSQVAEMTGRKGRVIAKSDGSFAYEPRSKDDVQLEVLNVAEKQRFMDGVKLIAVISEAASSGISLQADRRVQNQRRRVHITLELPWSADKAIQQFGRSHRSNQVSAPEYLFLISELAGEQRFASIVAKRLESLGALTHGDRRATESRDLSRFNFDTKYGRQALDSVLKSVIGLENSLVPPPKDYEGPFLEDVKQGLVGISLIQKDAHTGALTIADKDYSNISRFLNRILGLTVSLQNSLFQYFTDTLNAIIKEAKRSGRWDEGIVDLGSQGESVKQISTKSFLCPSTSGQVTTELVTVNVERGLSFTKACQMHKDLRDQNEGFYEASQLRNGKKTAVLVLKSTTSKNNLYTLYRPNIGLTLKQETITDINKKYTKVCAEDVEITWNDQYEYSENNCSHAFWRGYCKKKIVGLPCEVGTRKRACHILCGSVLSVWSKVESILACQPGASSKMQIIRAKLDNGTKLVGMVIPGNCVDPLKHLLSTDSSFLAK